MTTEAILALFIFMVTVVFLLWRPRGINEAVPTAIGAPLPSRADPHRPTIEPDYTRQRTNRPAPRRATLGMYASETPSMSGKKGWGETLPFLIEAYPARICYTRRNGAASFFLGSPLEERSLIHSTHAPGPPVMLKDACSSAHSRVQLTAPPATHGGTRL